MLMELMLSSVQVITEKELSINIKPKTAVNTTSAETSPSSRTKLVVLDCGSASPHKLPK
jgi:hypothetical protein